VPERDQQTLAPTDAGGNDAVGAAGSGSPRPTFPGAAAIPYREVTRFLWGDEVSGEVADWIYASTERIHMLVYALPTGGRCVHSDAHRTIFGADVVYVVLDGTLALANPEVGEVTVAERGEAILFRRDTWHHIFAHGTEPLRVLEFFAPPPSQGTSRSYAQRRPLLEEAIYADDARLGTWPPSARRVTLHRMTEREAIYRLDGDALVGVLATTEHLTVATFALQPGKRGAREVHGGDECAYVTEGLLHVRTWGEQEQWLELHPGDGLYCPAGTAHQYYNIGGAMAKGFLGVAPSWAA
jgi:quercetin dioxygenase-like cupin family protein